MLGELRMGFIGSTCRSRGGGWRGGRRCLRLWRGRRLWRNRKEEKGRGRKIKLKLKRGGRGRSRHRKKTKVGLEALMESHEMQFTPLMKKSRIDHHRFPFLIVSHLK